MYYISWALRRFEVPTSCTDSLSWQDSPACFNHLPGRCRTKAMLLLVRATLTPVLLFTLCYLLAFNQRLRTQLLKVSTCTKKTGHSYIKLETAAKSYIRIIPSLIISSCLFLYWKRLLVAFLAPFRSWSQWIVPVLSEFTILVQFSYQNCSNNSGTWKHCP